MKQAPWHTRQPQITKLPGLLLFFLLLAGGLCAQTYKLRIVDGADKKPVPFAVVIIDQTNRGATSDLDGNVEISPGPGAQNLNIQLVGYLRKTVIISSLSASSSNVIALAPDNIGLSEIVITPRENPAIAIIQKVIANKPTFNIENLPYYLCSTYSKTYFTFSGKDGDESLHDADTSFDKLKKHLSKSYLFFIESVTEKKYRYKNITQEKVLASRVSGFKDSPFGTFASELQSFTFYKDDIELLGLRYVSPLTSGTFKRYNFEIIDTVLSGADTTLLIRFHPKKDPKFKTMKGVLYINKNQYVLVNVLAEPGEIPSNGYGIKIQQLYSRVDSVHWFPRQLNTEILFSPPESKDMAAQSFKPMLKAVSRQYISGVRLDSAISIKNKSIAVYNEEDQASKPEAFWNSRRHDSLSTREQNTYVFMDSLGEKMKFDKKMKFLGALVTGKLPIGYFNLDLFQLLRVNDYEGIRVGLGFETNNKVSRWVSLGAYSGYGFMDKALKYGGSLRVNFNRRQSTYLLAQASSDVLESAGTQFLEGDLNFISTERLRNVLISRMDKVNSGRLSLNTSLFNYIRASAWGEVRQQTSPFGYIAQPGSYPWELNNRFNLNMAGLQLKVWPHEKFTESMGGRLMSLGSKWPVFYLNLSHGFTQKLGDYKGDFEFSKIDFRMNQQVNFKVKGFISYEVQAGKVFGEVPYSLQYNNKGSRSDNYWLSADKTMETMFLNEFVSTQYAAFFFAINSGQLLKFRKNFNPEVELVHNYIIGTLDNREHITNIQLRDLSKGYTEAGLRIKNLVKSGFNGFGVGVYYRYGNYASGTFNSDVVYKLVYAISF